MKVDEKDENFEAVGETVEKVNKTHEIIKVGDRDYGVCKEYEDELGKT